MSEATVRVPIVGFMVVGVNCESEKDAKEKAMNLVDEFIGKMSNAARNFEKFDQVFEWDLNSMSRLTSGNCNHFDCNEVEV